jgi:uncharacterized protein
VKKTPFIPVTSWVLLFCALALSACLTGPRPVTLYTLQPLQLNQQQEMPDLFADMIMVMPVRLAPQLRERGLLIQHSPQTSVALSNHLWAGSLDQQITGTLTANLKKLMATDNVVTYPGPRFSAPRYQVEVELNEFSGDGHLFTIRAVATISDVGMKTIVSRKSFRQTQVITKPDYAGHVDAASRAIADLSREIAVAFPTGQQPERIDDVPEQ